MMNAQLMRQSENHALRWRRRLTWTVAAIALLVGPQVALAKPQINITCTPVGGSENFFLYWGTQGNGSWPNYMFVDMYASSGEELSGYPVEDPTIYYVPALQLSPPASPTGSESDTAPGAATVVVSVSAEWNGDSCPSCAGGAFCGLHAKAAPTALPTPPYPPAVQVRLGDKRPVAGQPNTYSVYLELSTKTWTANTAYAKGTVISPPVPATATPVANAGLSNGQRYICTVAGTSGASQPPNWPTNIGGTVNDGGVTWTVIQPIANLRLVYGVFTKTDPDTGLITPLPEVDAQGQSHIFRRLRHAGSTTYSVSPSLPDNPFTITDLTLNLTGVAQGTYVYVDVFLVDLTADAVGYRKTWAAKRIQILP